MSNEWKMVPVEPTKEQTLAVCMHPDLARALYRSMVSAAPMPPTGDVRVMRYGFRSEYVSVLPDELDRLEIHAARLTAERDGLLADLDQMTTFRDNAANHMRRIRAECTATEKERDALQSELTKARIWERFAGYLLDNCEGQEIYEERLQYWLSEMLRKEKHQSAPAAKGGE